MTPFQLIANAQFFFAAPFGNSRAAGPLSFLALDHNNAERRYTLAPTADGWSEVHPAEPASNDLYARSLAEAFWDETGDASIEARRALVSFIGAGNAADLIMLVCRQRDHAALGTCLTSRGWRSMHSVTRNAEVEA